MVNLHKIAGEIIEYLDAFKGSRPALNSQFILIVRAISQKKIKADEIGDVLDQLIEKMNGHAINEFSEECGKLLNRMDEQIRSSTDVVGITDAGGVSKMKDSFEAMDVHVEYRFFETEYVGIFVVMWQDEEGFGPLYTEVVISDNEKE